MPKRGALIFGSLFVLCLAGIYTGISVFGNSTSGFDKVLRGVTSGPAIIPPQIDGTIESIKAGNPSYVILKDVTEFGNNVSRVHKSEVTLPLPSGHFVSADHWQSDGDTLDLFVGHWFTLMKDSGRMMESDPDPGFAGMIKSVDSKQMVVQKMLYDTSTTDSHAMKYTDETVTIHLAPYTVVTVNGMGTMKMPVSQMKVGHPVLFILIGPPNEYIATQITYFTSMEISGWHLTAGNSISPTSSTKPMETQKNNASVANSTKNSSSTTWIQVMSPKPNQSLKAGSTLSISGKLSRVQREPSIHVTLYQSPSSNCTKDGIILAQGNIPVQGSATFKGTLTVPKFSESKGNHFTLVFKYRWVPQVFTVQLAK